ncbi:unnamed protein product [Boreogadus saida]
MPGRGGINRPDDEEKEDALRSAACLSSARDEERTDAGVREGLSEARIIVFCSSGQARWVGFHFCNAAVSLFQRNWNRLWRVPQGTRLFLIGMTPWGALINPSAPPTQPSIPAGLLQSKAECFSTITNVLTLSKQCLKDHSTLSRAA